MGEAQWFMQIKLYTKVNGIKESNMEEEYSLISQGKEWKGIGKMGLPLH